MISVSTSAESTVSTVSSVRDQGSRSGSNQPQPASPCSIGQAPSGAQTMLTVLTQKPFVSGNRRFISDRDHDFGVGAIATFPQPEGVRLCAGRLIAGASIGRLSTFLVVDRNRGGMLSTMSPSFARRCRWMHRSLNLQDQLAGLPHQVSNVRAFLHGLASIAAMLKRVLVAPWGAGSQCTPMHAAALLTLD
jgi:hypothetical protein